MAFFDSPVSSGNSTHLMHQDSLLSQFLKLCLDNQQSTSSDRLNSFSSTSSSFGSYNFTDPISSPFNNLSPEFSSKLNACLEESETRSPFSLNFSLPQITYQTTGKRKSRRGSSAECAFCKNNGQPVSFYQSHVLKDRLGRVVCPILQAYNCPICNNGGGTQAHTVRYCPENKPTIKVKNSTSNRDKSDLFMQQDTLMAQFAKLYLNQQSTPITKLNSLSSSSSHDSCKVIDPIGTPFKRSNDDSNRRLKARPEGNLTSHHLSFNFTSTPVTNQKSAKRRSRRGSCMECVFCKNNGQPASFYQSHVLKDPLDRVVCPILSAYNCPICNNGGGPKAHTVRYCPENKPHARLRNALLKSATLLNSNQSIL